MEFGSRALGNRSICDPRLKHARDPNKYQNKV